MREARHITILVVVAAIVLGIVAVGAYAALADDTTPPVTTSDAAASYWGAATIHLTATDAEGVAYIYSKIDDGIARLFTVGTGSPAASVVIAAPAAGSVTHKLQYWAQDTAGNVEARTTTTITVKTDPTAPVTTATGAVAGGWYKRTVAVHLAAADEAAGSGVASISWSLDGAATTIAGASAYATLTVDARTTANGAHALTYQAADVAGNLESLNTLTINVDTKKPTTAAPHAAAVHKGRVAAVKYKASDAAPNSGTATVVIKIKNHAGKVVKSLNVGTVAVNVLRTKKFTCTLARGTYRFSVFARDAAGNTQVKAASNKLVVK